MDPFRHIFLEQVRSIIIRKEPCGESLHELLRTVDPRLSREELLIESTRRKKFKELRLRLHPDKHPGYPTVTSIFQDVQNFYDRCCENLCGPRAKRRRTCSPRRSTSLPIDFNAERKWPLIRSYRPIIYEVGGAEEIESIVAYRCINARGCISHGKKPELEYSHPLEYSHNNCAGKPGTAQDVFAKFGGTKRLGTIEDIKEEIMTNGPVVSTSFCLSREFLSATEYPDAFSMSKLDQTHDLLITGWRLSPYGELWLTKPLASNFSSRVTIPIAFGQFGVDDVCVAPISKLDDIHWQVGPYFVGEALPENWTAWGGISVTLSSEMLEKLASCFDHGLCEATREKTRFTIHEETRKGVSRACHLKEISWDKEEKIWRVRIGFLD